MWVYGDEFCFLAPLNSMACQIGGEAVLSWGRVRFKDRRGMTIAPKDSDHQETPAMTMKALYSYSVSFAHSAAAGKALTQVRYTSPGVEHRARVFFCKASSVASFVLRRVVHRFPWEIAAQHGCWHIFLFCLLAGIRFVNEHTFVVLFLRSTRPLLCLLKRPPKARNTGQNARHFF